MIRRSKVYLKGAYGPGNLGDDVLLICMIKILKELFVNDDISISINDINAGYHLDSDVNWVPLNSPIFSDITVLGGGGQFFSFKHNTKSRNKYIYSFNWLISKFKQGYTIIDMIIGFYLRIRYGVSYKTKNLATFCIGVGPFENGNDNECKRAIRIFQHADFLSVRDGVSKELIYKLCGRDSYQFVDITLNRELWYNNYTTKVNKVSKDIKPVVGIIIREWTLTDQGSKIISQLIDFENQNKDYDYVYISFYKKYDINVINNLEGREIMIWDPKDFTINSFIEKIKEECNVIVSTRAHGVLLSTMAYIPSIAVEIEPKLEAVQKMMPQSIQLVKSDKLDDLSKYIDFALNDKESDFIRKVDDDLFNNSKIAEESILKLKEWLKEVKE